MRVLLCLLLVASTASAGELKTLKGDILKGELVSLGPKEAVFESEGKKITTPIDQVVSITLSDDFVKLGAEDKFIQIEMIDGSQLKCASAQFKGKEVLLQTLQDQKVTLPVSKLNWLLNEANNAENMKGFRERVLTKKKAFDMVARKNEDVIAAIEGTIGEVDEKGETFKFNRQSDGSEITFTFAKVLGLFYQRQGATALPSVCRLTDVHRNLLYVSEIKKDDDGYTVVTSGGATVKYTSKQVAKLDYSFGKLAYLSELTPQTIKETSTEGRVDHYKRDVNLEGGPIRLGGVEYKRGLSMHSTTEIEYDLEGEYRELKAKVGIDDMVGGGDDPVVLKVFLDNVERLNWSISRKDMQKVRDLVLNVKDVKQLKIVVTTSDLLDLGKHVTLADARVSK